MPSCLPQLVASLSSKRDGMEKLLQLLKEEQQSIINVDLVRLENLDALKRELLGVMERGNAEYRLLLRDAAREMNLEKVENLTPIINKCPPPYSETLGKLQASLLETGDTLNHVLDSNRGLLENSLKHVHENIAFFHSLINSNRTYGDAGNMVTANSSARLVCKEA